MIDPSYALEFAPAAEKDLRHLDRDTASRIVTRLRRAAENAGINQHKALKGEFSGLYSLRIGAFRAIYSLYHDQRVMVVKKIGHRRDVYDE